VKTHEPFARALALLASATCFAAAGCLPQQRPQAFEPVVVTAGVPPAAVDLRRLSLEPGAHDHEIEVAGQGARSAEIWMPDNPPRTLVIVLHGTVVKKAGPPRGTPGAQTHGLVRCLTAPALAPLDPIIIAPRSADGQWWRREDTELVLGLVGAVRERWPAIGDRTVIMGYSNGGIGTWYFARLYPDYFAAAIPMAFSDDIVGPSALPIYAIVGTKDEQFDIARVRAAVSALKANGQDLTMNEKQRGSHYRMCSYLPELSDAGRWLEEHAFRTRKHSPDAVR
jgi:poly(3-hydroxybutyrate) depolymerase